MSPATASSCSLHLCPGIPAWSASAKQSAVPQVYPSPKCKCSSHSESCAQTHWQHRQPAQPP
eukprot:3530160-Amphidinium_carterae.1